MSQFGFSSTADEVLEGKDLKGRTVLVTGGYSGLGQETARAMAAKGAHVILSGRDATKLSATADEIATGIRLQKHLRIRVFESKHIGAEFVDGFGRSYDALGTPMASQYWNQTKFIRSIEAHLLKSNDFTVIDLTGFSQNQVRAVQSYIDALPPLSQQRIIRIGF